MAVPFVDLKAAYEAQKTTIDTAVSRVLSSGWYILGREAQQFEQAFAAYLGVPHAVGVASGTDALLLGLRALGVGPGDEVITVAHTAVATVAAIELAGATPVLVDVDPVTYTLDPFLLETAVTPRTKAIIPVHIYGHPADMDPILELAAQHKLAVLEDCAQAHGATYQGKRVGSLGDAAAFSFYPTKNLGAMGDGGLVATKQADVAARLQLLRQYGWKDRYVSDIAGYNSRLDELQAAILHARLADLEAGNAARRAGATLYQQLLAGLPLTRPQEWPGTTHVYHLYVLQVEQRDALAAFLREREIGTAVHYPLPIHLQPAYTRLGYQPGSLPVTERLATRILSLPLYPDIPEEHIHLTAKAITDYFKSTAKPSPTPDRAQTTGFRGKRH